MRNDSTKIHYGYSAAGAKLSEQISLGQTLLSRTDYSGTLVLHDGLPERILTDEGTLEYTTASGGGGASWQPRFFLRDHLGSVRVIADASGAVLQRHHFYPYGADLDALFASGGGHGGGFIPADSLIIIGPGIGGNGTGTASPQGGGLDGGGLIDDGEAPAAQTSTSLPYRFAGKERLDRAGLPLYDFGARWYNPATPAWTTPDPLAEKYYDLSPYAYCAGDPVNLVDSLGRSLSAPIKIFKAVRKAYKASKTAQKVTAGALALNEIYSYYDNFNTLSNSESSWAEKGLAAIDVLTGFGSEAKSLAKSLGFHGLLETSFRSFTYKNFRHNLGQLTGGIPEGMQAHHTLPNAFRKEFEQLGINIDDPKYGVWLETSIHQKTKDPYNARWKVFFEDHNDKGVKATVEEIENYAQQLMQEFYGHSQ